MSHEDIILDHVDHLTVDALGKPGQRVFYIQASQGDQKIPLLIEKFQLQSLLDGTKDFFDEIHKRFPDLAESIASFQEEEMHIQPPVDPLFRAGDIGLAYDEIRDLACLFARESDLAVENQRTARFWCTREQLTTFTHWGKIIIQRGRPICPQCGQLIEPTGHFCPKKNGHKRIKK